MIVLRVCASTCGKTAGRNDNASSLDTNNCMVPPAPATATYTPDLATLNPTPLRTTSRVCDAVRSMSAERYIHIYVSLYA